MAEAQTLTLTEVILHLRSQMLEALHRPPSAENRAVLTGLWRTCLSIHDVADARQNRTYVRLMERMIDAVTEYDQIDQPERMDWESALPSAADIEMAAR